MRHHALLAAGLFLFVGPLPAVADVDVEVESGDKVTGTLAPADEVETFRVTIPAGSSLSVKVKGKKVKGVSPAPSPGLQVLDAGDVDIAAGLVVVKGVSSKLKKLPIAVTGEYRVRVMGDGVTEGNYEIKLKWKEPKKIVIEGAVGEGPFEAPFAAGQGALCTFQVKRAKGSAADPQLVRVAQVPEGFSRDFAPGLGKAKKIPLPATAGYLLRVSDQGVVGGGVVVTLKLKQAKPQKRKIRITTDEIGAGGGDDSVLGNIVGADGDQFFVPEGDPNGIEGAGIEIPPGAVDGDTVFLIGSAPEIFPPDEENEGAGPTVFFGPEGQQFDVDVTVVLPIDLALFGGDFSGLQIFQRDGDGAETLVPPPYVIDDVNGVVRFPASHFTAFRAFGPVRADPPVTGDVDNDGVAELFVVAPKAVNNDGAVFAFRGRTSLDVDLIGATTVNADFILMPTGGGTQPGLGATLASGDVNGDGRADLLIGAPNSSGGVGQVAILLGQDVPHVDGLPSFDLTDGAEDTEFGRRGLAVGDLNGDGVDDVVVGTPTAAVVGRGNAGAVLVFFGGVQISEADVPAVVIEGNRNGQRLGSSVAVADVTGDGVNDLIVGDYQLGAIVAPGVVHVFRGPLSAGAGDVTGASVTLTGEGSFHAFGSQVAAGDFNNDGVADVVVSAPAFGDPDEPADFELGKVYVFFGGDGLVSESGDLADVQLTGVGGGQRFGTSLEVEDVTGDAVADVIVGAPGDSSVTAFQGSVFVYRGRLTPPQVFDSTSADFTFAGESMGSAFGFLQEPMDVTGDGVRDLIVYAPANTSGGASTGRCYVFTGGPLLSDTSAGQANVIVTGTAGQFLGAFDLQDVPGL